MKVRLAGRARLFPLVFLVMTGCVTPQISLLPGYSTSSSAAPVMVVSTWENHVVFPQDTVSGQPMPSLIGSVYLLPEDDGRPVPCDGTLRVDLYDATQVGSAEVLGQPLERWTFDKNNMKKLLRKGKDFMGGQRYIVPLMWSSYRPDISKVQLQLTFIPEKGTPIQAAPHMVTLNSEVSRPVAQQKRDVPAAPGAAPSGPAPMALPLPSNTATSRPGVTRIPLPVTGSR